MTELLNTAISVPCHPKNRGGWRKTSDILYLVFHYTGNDGDTDAANAEYYRDNVVKASAHYFVDDDSVTRSVTDDYRAWAVGGKKWSDCPRTGGGRFYGLVTNANSISIEMCDTKRDGTIMATEATLARAAALGRELMAKYNIPIERVVRHFDVTGKHCPAYFMDEGKWAAFKKRLVEEPKQEEKEMTKKEVLKLIEEAKPKVYTTEEECPAWARPLVAKLKAEKVLQGNEAGKLYLTDDILVVLQALTNAGVLAVSTLDTGKEGE